MDTSKGPSSPRSSSVVVLDKCHVSFVMKFIIMPKTSSAATHVPSSRFASALKLKAAVFMQPGTSSCLLGSRGYMS